MPRPSRHLDRALLAAGRALLPRYGCSGLSIRRVAEEAGVNPGMFHYHFKTRDAFLAALLQETYDGMFARFLPLADQAGAPPRERLRAALGVLGRFLRDHRPLIARVLADALAGSKVALGFLTRNLPRHLGVLDGLLAEAQAAGEVRHLARPQALGFCAGALALPILFGGEAAARGRAELGDALLSDRALDERIELALAALAPPAAARPGKAGRP